MLTDKDVAIHLMNDKVAGEEVYFHSLNVAVLAMIIGKELKPSTEDIRTLGIGAMFHDIGMVEIPEKITLKTDPLTRAEIDFMRQHVQYGVDIGKRVGLTPGALAIIAQHHEYIDGTGYPKGAKGEKSIRWQNHHPGQRLRRVVQSHQPGRIDDTARGTVADVLAAP